MNFRENMSRSREVLGAYWRQGLHELGAAFYGPGTVAQSPEYGMIATKTPGQVADGLRADEKSTPARDDMSGPQAPSALDAHLDQARDRWEREMEPEREEPTMERE